MHKILTLCLMSFILNISGLTKSELIQATIINCKSQLAKNPKHETGLILLHYLNTEAANNRDVLLLKAKQSKKLPIEADEPGDLVSLAKMFEKASLAYAKAKKYKTAAYYISIAEHLNELSDDGIIIQHKLAKNGYSSNRRFLLGPYISIAVASRKKLKGDDVDIDIDIDTGTKHHTRNKLKTTATLNGHKYTLVKENSTWSQANQKAKNMGGYLVCINSLEENNLVKSLIPKLGFEVWTGASDQRSEGNWGWINGDRMTFSNWSPNNPDNFNGNEDYAILRGNGKWNDLNAEKLRWFIVEWD